MPKRESRFPLSAIEGAITAAGAPPELKARILQELEKTRPKRGRREEPDDEALLKVINLLQNEDPDDPKVINVAAARVSKDSPPPLRNALRKRLIRKTKKLVQQSREQVQANAAVELLRQRLEKAEREIAEYESRVARAPSKIQR